VLRLPLRGAARAAHRIVVLVRFAGDARYAPAARRIVARNPSF
jgi:hypothetical protein